MNGASLREIGLLVLRLGIGVLFVWRGYPKIMAGTQMWTGLGQAMGNLGITFAPAFWGFMAALAEFGGGICLILGVFFRIACGMMAFTMVVAALMHLSKGDGLAVASHAVELCVVFVSLLLMGAGRYSLSARSSLKFLK